MCRAGGRLTDQTVPRYRTGQGANVRCAEDRPAADNDDVAITGDCCSSSNHVRELLAVHRLLRGLPASWARHSSTAVRRSCSVSDPANGEFCRNSRPRRERSVSAARIRSTEPLRSRSQTAKPTHSADIERTPADTAPTGVCQEFCVSDVI